MKLYQVKNHLRIVRMTFLKARKIYTGLFVFSVATVILELINNLYIGKIIDIAITTAEKGNEFSKLLLPFAIFMGILFSLVIAREIKGYFDITYNNLLELIIDDYKFNKSIEIDPQSYIDPKYVTKKTVINWNGWKVTEAAKKIVELFAALLPAIIYLVILYQYNWKISILTALSTIPTIFISIKFGKRVWGIWDDNSGEKVVWNIYRNSLSGNISAVKQMGVGPYIIDKILSLHNKFFNRIKDNEKRRLVTTLLISLFEYSLIAGAYYILFNGIVHNIFTIGTFYIVSASLWGTKRELTNFFSQYATIESNASFIDDFIDLMNWKSVITSKENAIKTSRKKPIKIEFKDVWFKYPNSKEWVFKGLNFVMNADDDSAIVGRNGAGKTTMTKLIMRMYDPTKGMVLINDIPLQNINLESYLQGVGLLDQDFEIHEFSVKENIMLGDINNTDKQKHVEKYAKMAQAHEFITKLKKGYDTFLTTDLPEGQLLSGGQNQRLAIARMFYREPQLLILDEPTSAIDSIAEEQIFNDIFEFAANRTVIIISHRFATVKKASMIYVLDEGEIIEQGSHNELVKMGGLYKKMYDTQSDE